jgi:hypothetical protein
VQYKNQLSDAQWLAFGPQLTAASNRMWVSDSVTNSLHKFYRIEQSN